MTKRSAITQIITYLLVGENFPEIFPFHNIDKMTHFITSRNKKAKRCIQSCTQSKGELKYKAQRISLGFPAGPKKKKIA